MRFLRPRKRIVATEVAPSVDATPDTVHADAIVPADPGTGRVDDRVLDPTLLSERHRKRAHSFTYRITQVLLIACYLAASAGLLCFLLEEPEAGRWLAASAGVVALGSWRLGSLTPLSSRLRGYAVAGFVLAVVTFAVMYFPEPDWFKSDTPASPRDLCLPRPNPPH